MNRPLAKLVMQIITAVAAMHGMHAAQAEAFERHSVLYARLPPATGGHAATPVFSRLSGSDSQPAQDEAVPLGSLWKLFVYAYATDNAVNMPDYRCREKSRLAQEMYCCDPGVSIGKDDALVQSCGLFFEPGRLKIREADWAEYWHKHAPQAHWLEKLQNLQPSTRVSVTSLLMAMSGIAQPVRRKLENTLMGVVLSGRGKDALGYLGGRYRVKTYTWNHPQHAKLMVGGAAGWLNDGSAVWFGAVGSSTHVIRNFAPVLAKAAEEAGSVGTGQCVEVDMFSRYPLQRILKLPGLVALQTGDTQMPGGMYQLVFANGKSIQIQGNGMMQVRWEGDTPSLLARLDEAEYVARVIDREAGTQEAEAARAFGLVARSYLYQNAKRSGQCLRIQDSTQTQRVSPNPATALAMQATSFTAGLLLDGVHVQYRTRESGRNILSWQAAREMAGKGARYHEILRHFYPEATLASMSSEKECQIMPVAETWLKRKITAWRAQLQMEPGYSEPAFQVCHLYSGNPYSDTSRQRIYVRGMYALNDHITLAHEYLHLAFAQYPSGQDEKYIEMWARRLIEGESNI